MLITIFSILIILAVFVFGYLGFGLFLLEKLKLKFPTIDHGLISVLLSVSLLTSIIAILGQLMGTSAYYLLVLAVTIGLTQTLKISEMAKKLFKKCLNNKLGSVFIILSILTLLSTIVFGRVKLDGSLSLQEVHDSTWHIALIENLQQSIPPKHPSDATVTLSNYHYFYDLFLTGFTKFSGISLFILYFQLSAIFLSVILVLSSFVLGKKLNGKLAGYFLVAFTTFAGSFAYLIPIFNQGQTWHESSFWVSQTLVMMVNPQIIYTLAITYLFVYLLQILSVIKPTNKKYFRLNLLIIILIATSIGFKSYAWIILTSIYGLYLFIELIKYRSVKTITVGVLYLLISAPFVWIITGLKGSTFFYQPLWFTNSMIESPDRVNYLEWKFLKDYYLFKKNWIHLFILETKKIAIFYFGNLGIRSIFIGLPLMFLIEKRTNQKNNNKFWPIVPYVFFGFLFSSIFPLLFLQSGTAWNSIQFWYYALIFANILAVIFLSKLLEKKNKLLFLIILIILFALAIPTSIKTIHEKNKQPYMMSQNKMLLLKSLLPSDKIIICPEGSDLYNSALIKVLTPAQIYLANPAQLELVGIDKTKYLNFEKIVNSGNNSELNIIIETEKISIILCRDDHLVNKFKEMFNKSEISIEATQIENWHYFYL